MNPFDLQAPFSPSGDQPEAISALAQNIQAGEMYQILLGVTGSGKTMTMASVIQKLQRPTLIIAHNKTLAAQLYQEFKQLFPNNSVEYFVSYYDYYQPEAYVPASDTYINKDSSINQHIEQMRLSATKALLERRDCIIVASVSCIYGLGDPESYLEMVLHIQKNDSLSQREILRHLAKLQYQRNEFSFERGHFRVRGETIDIFPAEEEKNALRITLFDDIVESLVLFDPITGKSLESIQRFTVYPKTHYATDHNKILNVIAAIEKELITQIAYLNDNNKLVEAQRLEQRTRHDLEMLSELGFCNGIENYSRYLSGRSSGQSPPTLIDYLPNDALLFIDESHVTIPQISAMYKADKSRKENLVNYGFRLPSALDNRPLKFNEWELLCPQTVFVSATPARYEREKTSTIVEQIIRPTGLVDPTIVIHPVENQVDHLFSTIQTAIEKSECVLVTTLTKQMAENLASYLEDHNVPAAYLHSDIDTVERMELIRNLRLKKFHVLIGINLLREGLDIPEVSTVAILDADKEGFLRSESSLIQTIGRAARNIHGKAILYADKETQAIKNTIAETERRRKIQLDYNELNNITPKSISKKITESLMESKDLATESTSLKNTKQQKRKNTGQNLESHLAAIDKLEKEMLLHAENLEFEQAILLRDKILSLRNEGLS